MNGGYRRYKVNTSSLLSWGQLKSSHGWWAFLLPSHGAFALRRSKRRKSHLLIDEAVMRFAVLLLLLDNKVMNS